MHRQGFGTTDQCQHSTGCIIGIRDIFMTTEPMMTVADESEDMYAEAVKDFRYEHYEDSYSYSSSTHVNAHDKLVPNSHGHDENHDGLERSVVLHNLNFTHGLEHEHEHDNDNGDLFS
jgi:hypothetical protein